MEIPESIFVCLLELYDENTKEYYLEDYFTMLVLSECVTNSTFEWRDIGDKIFDISLTPWSKFYKHDLIIRSRAKFQVNTIFQDNIFFWDILFNSNKIYFYDIFNSIITSNHHFEYNLIGIKQGI